MKVYLKSLLTGIFLLIAIGGITSDLNAQAGTDRWNDLRSLKEGTRLVVDYDGQPALKAKFSGATDQSLAVMSKGKRVEITRDQISAVYLGRKSSKLKRGLIGGLAGAGAGLLVGAATIAATKGDPLIAAGGFLYGIPIGAAIGVATAGGTKKGDLLYSR